MNAMNDPTAAATDLGQFLRAERARILNNLQPPMSYRPMMNNHPPPPHGPMLNDFMVYDSSAAPHPPYKYNSLNQATWKNRYNHKPNPYRYSKPPPAPPVHSMKESPIQETIAEPIEDDMTMVARILKPVWHSAKESLIIEDSIEESTEDAHVLGLANEGESLETVQDSVYDTMLAVTVRFEWMDEIGKQTYALRDTMTRMRDEAKKLQLLKESFLTKIGRVNDAASIFERADFCLAEKIHETPKESQALRKATRNVRKAKAKFRDEAAGLWSADHADYLNESLASYEELIEEMESQLQHAKTLISGQKLNDGKKRKRVEE